ncbi:hypothetical protein L596_027978 [Steinernema carpocapsae]|uniref:Uncharacterized protein n=1 Tax=Steinernema carpocapsae TaxID=34508 RepID=A0A4U5LX76_STECR|nr:hypothetical protein L596_027978 [Steinernema carpocapsae]
MVTRTPTYKPLRNALGFSRLSELAESPPTAGLRLGWPSATVVLAILLFSIFTSFTSTTNPPKHFNT